MAEIAGLKLIVPSSVTADAGATASVSSSGKVTFADVTLTKTIKIEGIFSSTYDNYLIVMQVLGGGGDVVGMRLRASGSDASGTDYTWQRILAASTTVSGTRSTSQTLFAVGRDAPTATIAGHHIYIYGPNLAQPTATRNVSVDPDNGARISDYACTHSLSTAYTGLSVFNSGSTDMDGTLCVYGLSQ